jgi:ComF family protein
VRQLKQLEKILLFITDIIYPNRCACCDKFISYDKFCCEHCLKRLRDIECEDDFCCFYYSDVAINGIVRNKDRNTNFGIYCGMILGKKLKNVKADFIIPVPMYKHKKKYNHAEIIAKIISKMLNIPLRTDILYKLDGAPEQHSLKAAQRSEYLNFFKVNKTNLTGKTIILVDDVITTGNTMRRCKELLKENGAEKVIIASATRSKYIIGE